MTAAWDKPEKKIIKLLKYVGSKAQKQEIVLKASIITNLPIPNVSHCNEAVFCLYGKKSLFIMRQGRGSEATEAVFCL